MDAKQRTAHAEKVRAQAQADREQRAGWKARGLMRPVDPRRK